MAIKCPKCHFENPDNTVYCGKCASPLKPAEVVSVTKTIETPVEEYPRGSSFADRYKIIEKLGTGGMGAVFRVEDTNIGQDIALKLIKSDIASDKKTIERFRNELKTTRMISHRNVCRMFDLAETEGTYYITMEYVPGEDLKSLIRRVRRLDSATAITIAKQVCEGLSEAHGLGVVHRDLKSSNIMIDKEGNVRIMDFGIARSHRAKGITGEGIIIGTPEYMSLEQAEAKEVDHRSDIYSLGVILYEMVTGELPFEGDTPLSIAMKHKGEIPKNPKELNPQIRENLNVLILKCLEKDKESRYQSAEELYSELNAIEKGLSTTEKVIPKRKPLTSKEITVTFGLKKLVIPAVIIVAMAIIAVVLFRGKGLDVDPNRVLVAIFENQTGEPKFDPIGRMASDWVTQGIPGLVTVLPLPSEEISTQSRQSKDPIRFLANETGAGTVVSGSYYLQGENISFHAQITNAKEKKLLSAIEPVSVPANDPVKAIELLRQRIIGSLATIFDPDFGPLIETGIPIPTYEAYQEFIEGSKFFTRRELKEAIVHYSRSAELDPSFLLPVILAAVAHLNLGEYDKADFLVKKIETSREKLSPVDRAWFDWVNAILRGDFADSHRITRQLAQKFQIDIWVLELGGAANRNNHPKETVEAYKKLDPERGWMKGRYEYWHHLTMAHHMLGNHKQELKEAQRGRKQYPNLLTTLWYEVRALTALGRIEDVSKRLDESLTLPPQRGWTPGKVMSLAGQYLRIHGYKEASLQMVDRAVRWFESRPKEESETRIRRSSLATALYIAERWEEAHAIYKALHEEFPEIVDYLGYLGTLAARIGDREKALRVSDQLEEIKRPYLFGNNTYWRACIAALLGEKENAMRLLRDALGQGVSYLRLYTNIDLEPLFDYPPFKELIKPKG